MDAENVLNCHICGTTEELEQFQVDREEIHLCPDCRDEHLKQCSDCGEYFIDNENDYVIDREGDIYCESCREELSFCEHCEEYSCSEDFVHLEDTDEWWCRSCAERDAYQCMDCSDWISENHGDSNHILCSGCFEDRYAFCHDCGDLIHIDDSFSTDDGIYCEDCYSNHASNVHNYSYEPCLNFQCADDENDEKPLPYLGFELESGGLATANARNAIADSLTDRDGEETFYLKEDGSIPDYGFELVSHPITLKRHKELDWQAVLATMSDSGLKSHDLGEAGCGLHVHVSRNYLTSYKWLLIDWLVSKHQAEFEVIARRKETHWAKFKKSNGQSVKDIFGKSNGSRYQAVNFENRRTVEFRLFRGTLKYSTFMATLEIVDALVHWAKQVCIHDILNSKNAFHDFTKYVLSHADTYSNAIDYLNSQNLI